ncbi:unnamed protein product [Phaedon cochleariae]|uniref:Uncharacterized protein n=1 Tax=Phaedon cochleariae TaxID=80249 RepID=A0A9P0DYN5_PHACE|nr:unnamed protein product [Phaedon cochleariae]
MSRKSQIILDVCEILAQQENLKVTVKESAKGAAIVGVGTFIGALFGGKNGLLAGAALGSAAAMALVSEFKSVVEIIRDDMNDTEREKLARSVGSLLKGINITSVGAVVAAVSAKSGLKSKVVNEITNFLQNEMQLNVS